MASVCSSKAHRRKIHPKNKQVHLNKFRWPPDSCHREEGKSSHGLFEKVHAKTELFLGISGFGVIFWASESFLPVYILCQSVRAMLVQSETGKVCRVACPLLDPLLTLPPTEQLRTNTQAQPCDLLPRQEAALELITTPQGPNAVMAANPRSSE